MIKTVEFRSRIGADGVLDLHVPLRELGAGANVVVTVRAAHAEQAPAMADSAERRRILDESYGSCDGLGLERQPQGQFETREGFE